MPISPDRQAKKDRLTSDNPGWLVALTLNCREVTRLTSEERERILPRRLKLGLRLHRLFCRWCARYAGQLGFLHQAAKASSAHLDQVDGPPLGEDAKARMKRALQKGVAKEAFPPGE